MPERIDETIVRIRADKAASDDLARRISALKSRLAELTEQEAALKSAMSNGESVASQYARTVTQRRDIAFQLRTAEEAYRDALLETVSAEEKAARAVKQTAAARETAHSQTSVQGLGYSAANIADVFGGGAGRSVRVGTQLVEAAQGVKSLGSALPMLASNLGIATAAFPALGAAAVAAGAALVVAKEQFDAITGGANAAKQAIMAQVAAYREYYQFVATATREQVQAETQRVMVQQGANRQLYAALLELKNTVEQGLDTDTLAEGTIELLDAIGALDFGMDELNDAIKQVETEIQAGDAYFGMLSKAIQEGATAANDAAVMEEQARQRRLSGLEAEAQARIQTDQQIRTATSETIEERLKQIESERAAYADLKAALEQAGGAGERVQQLNDQLYNLERESERLNNVVLPAVRAREAEANKAESLRESLARLRDEREKERAAAEKQAAALIKNATAYQQNISKATAERNQKLARDEEDFTRRRARDLEDYYAAAAKSDQDYYTKRAAMIAEMTKPDGKDAEALAEYQKDTQRATRDHLRELLRIERDGQRTIQDAAERMRAAEILDARRAKDDALKDAQDEFSLKQQDRAEDFRELQLSIAEEQREKRAAAQQALQDLADQHRQEQMEREAAFRLKLAREDEDRRIAAQREQADFQARLSAMAESYAQQQGLTANHLTTMNTLVNTGFGNMANAIRNAMASISGASVPVAAKSAVNTAPVVAKSSSQITGNLAPGGNRAGSTITVNISGSSDPEATADAVMTRLARMMSA